MELDVSQGFVHPATAFPFQAELTLEAQDVGGDAALTRRVKELESSNAGLLARASAAEAQSAEAARRAAQYLKRIKAAAAALEVL